MVEYLEWDSNFFDLRIGKTVVSSQLELNNLAKMQPRLSQGYDLIYVFAKKGLLAPDGSFSLVDQKTIFKTKIESVCGNINDNIIQFDDKYVTEDLLKLALVSGEYSRFRLDKRLTGDAYERLYSCWIEQSVKHIIATEIFCYMIDGKPKGLLTLNRQGMKGIIGLVATDPISQGNGIGGALLQYVKNFCANNGVIELSVTTQLRNKAACHLYEKAGFIMESCTDIWHLWL